jgi:hypothetical protein
MKCEMTSDTRIAGAGGSARKAAVSNVVGAPRQGVLGIMVDTLDGFGVGHVTAL